MKKVIPVQYLRQLETKKLQRIDDLIAEFLTEGLKSAIRLDKITLNEDWLLQHDATSIATFYSVKADKLIRFFDSLSNGNFLRYQELRIAVRGNYLGWNRAGVSDHGGNA